MTASVRSGFLKQLIAIVGDKHVLTEHAATQPYLIEQRNLFKSECMAVIRPANTQEVSQCVQHCNAHDTAIVPIGGNTGLCGGAVANQDQIILSTERLNQIREIDPENYSMTVEAGCILQTLQQVAEQRDRLFPLSLGAEGSCQIGGNLSTNAGGINVLHYGNARDLCLGIEAVLPDGSLYSDLSGLRKDNTGYALKHLFMGAEGTLGVITAATLKLFPRPRETLAALVAVDDLSTVISLYNSLREASSDRITTFELIPQIAIELTHKHFPGCVPQLSDDTPWAVLLVIHSTKVEPELSDSITEQLASLLEQNQISDALIAQNLEQENQFMALREKLVEAQKLEGASIKHDISVPISSIPAFIVKASQTIESLAPGARPYPFGHVGDGNLHFNISQPIDADPEDFMAKREQVNHAIHEIVHEFAGSFSAEHGIGRLKTDLIARYKGDVALTAMRSIKHALDPKNIMNPGNVIGKPCGEASD